jgi:hypothetical protein
MVVHVVPSVDVQESAAGRSLEAEVGLVGYPARSAISHRVVELEPVKPQIIESPRGHCISCDCCDPPATSGGQHPVGDLANARGEMNAAQGDSTNDNIPIGLVDDGPAGIRFTLPGAAPALDPCQSLLCVEGFEIPLLDTWIGVPSTTADTSGGAHGRSAIVAASRTGCALPFMAPGGTTGPVRSGTQAVCPIAWTSEGASIEDPVRPNNSLRYHDLEERPRVRTSSCSRRVPRASL